MSSEYGSVLCILCGKSVDSQQSAKLGEKRHLWNLIPSHIQIARKELPVTERNACRYCYDKLQDWYAFTNQLVVGTEEAEAHMEKQAWEAESGEAFDPLYQAHLEEEKAPVQGELEGAQRDVSGMIASESSHKVPLPQTNTVSSPRTPQLVCSRAKEHSGKTGGATEEERPNELQQTACNNKPVKQSRFTLEYLRERLNRPISEAEEVQLEALIAKGDDRGIYNYLLGGGSKQLWDCQICTLSIQGGMTDVVHHYSQAHNSKPIFICKLCGKKITSIHTFIRHRQSHLVEVKCPVCGKIFADRSKLYMHKPMHSEKRPYVCLECGSGYKMLSHLKNHQERAHVPADQKASFTCQFCGKIFGARSNLSTHISQTHNPNRQFVCDICGKVLKAKQALECHLKSHAGIKAFQCQMCEDKFSTKASLNAHVRRHTGEKPYTCQECGKNFTNRSARNSHMQFVHTNERKFVCEVCGKGFKVQRDLKVHGSVHTGEKPFVCTCGKTFRAGANYYAHRRLHRKETDAQQGSTSLPEESAVVQRPEGLAATDQGVIFRDSPTTVRTGVDGTVAPTYHNMAATSMGTCEASTCMLVSCTVLETAVSDFAIIGYSSS